MLNEALSVCKIILIRPLMKPPDCINCYCYNSKFFQARISNFHHYKLRIIQQSNIYSFQISDSDFGICNGSVVCFFVHVELDVATIYCTCQPASICIWHIVYAETHLCLACFVAF